MKKIAILYICTGKYSKFWKKFYKYCQKNFLLSSEKHYYIFSDNKKILSLKQDNIHPIYQEVEEWPFPTLHRFRYFLKVRNELMNYDFVIFMNSNLIVKKKIFESEILPTENQRLFVTLHPGFYNKRPNEYTYERNPLSSAYIPISKGQYYFAGGLNGGYSKDFIELIDILEKRIDDDYKNGIIAVWHDESHLNKYMYEYNLEYKILSPSYLYPEGWKLPFEEKIRILDKSKKGGHKYLRNIKE